MTLITSVNILLESLILYTVQAFIFVWLKFRYFTEMGYSLAYKFVDSLS